MEENEATRASLQERLGSYAGVIFWSFVVLVAFLIGMYVVFPPLRPPHIDEILVGGDAMLATLAIIWRRGLKTKRRRTIATMRKLDLLIALGTGVVFAASGVLQPKLQAAGWCSFIFACLAVFTRAMLVPSNARWTATISTVVFAPILLMAIGLSMWSTHELPPTALVGGTAAISLVVILIAAKGSDVIYDLRHEVTDLGQYKVVREIGRGGMGIVYEARHTRLRRPTAVKVLHPERMREIDIERFEHEVQHMSELTHPNTATVYDYGRSGNTFYYAMEYLGHGIDLDDLIRREKRPLPAGRVVSILAQVCGALQEAHEAKLVHGDIKPDNIILCERGGMPDVAKVVDFGLVKLATAAESTVIAGTPAYMAPETFEGKSTFSVDLYALGLVGYYLLTAEAAFKGSDSLIVESQRSGMPPPPSSIVNVPPDLDALIMRCIAKDPADRPASAAALAAALHALKPTAWTDDDARTWWRNYREKTETVLAVSTAATMTIDVDVNR